MPTGHYQRNPRAERIVFNCQACGTEIRITPGQLRQRPKPPRFCSQKCHGESRVRSGSRMLFSCDQCGKESSKRADHWKDKNYCSAKCSSLAHMVDGAKWRDPEKIKQYMSEYAKSNRQRINALSREWKKRNRASANAIQQARRAGGGQFTAEEWAEIKSRYDNRCLACGRQEPEIKLEADHVLPLVMDGEHSARNIQPLCRNCNAKKGGKHIDYRQNLLKACHGLDVEEVRV